MSNNEKMICQIFETEMWLYIDRSLSDTRMEFWRSHLRMCNTCRELLAQSEEVVSCATENLTENMEEILFEEMVSKAIKSKRLGLIRLALINKKEKIISIGKVVLASALVIIAVLVSLLSDKPGSIKSVSKEIFEWEGSVIKTEMDKIAGTINMLNQNDWDRQMQILDKKIEVIEQNTDKLSFN